MEYKLVPIYPSKEEIKIKIPEDIVVDDASIRLIQHLSNKGVFKDSKGRLSIHGTSVQNSDFQKIIEYLINGQGKRPKGLRKLLHSIKIPKRLSKIRRAI